VERLGTQTLVDHPELPAAGAIASGLLSRSASERARLLQLADRSLAEHPERSSPYVQSAVSLARSAWIDGDTGGAVANGRRAAELGRTNGHETAVAALAALAFALFVQGDLEEARAVAQEAIDRADAPDRPHGVVYANATLALLELELGRPRAAEAHAQRALETADAAGLARSWTAGLAHTALGSALAALGDLGRAERAAERGEALRRGPEPSVEGVHARLILAQVRVARRRLAAASADLERAAEALAGFEDPGRLPVLAGGIAAALETAKGSSPALAEEPSPSEFAVLRLLATDLTQRQIGQQLYLSLNTVKTHTRGIYRKLGATSRQEAVAHAETLGLIENGNDPSV
jgi:LuxR family maltose regulon positive regulatory protein